MPLTSTASSPALAVEAEAAFMRALSSSRRSFFSSSSCCERRVWRAAAGESEVPPMSDETTRATDASRRNSGERAGAGDGFNAADAGGDGGLAGEFEEADFPGGAGVDAAAELGGEAADFHDADLVAVLFAEEGGGVKVVDGGVDGDVDEGLDAGVGEDFAVDDVLDFLQFFWRDAGEVAEVEAKAGAVDERAGLLDVGAEHLAQGRVDEVGAGVVAHGAAAFGAVDDRGDCVADGEAFAGGDAVGEDALHGFGGAADVGEDVCAVRGVEPAGVADLAAGVGVEGGVVEHGFALLAGFQFVDAEAVLDEGEDLCAFGAEGGVAFEVGFREGRIDGAGGLLGAAFPGGSGAGLFFFFGEFETGEVEV